MNNKDKMDWLNAHGTFVTLPYGNDTPGVYWLNGRWISRCGNYRHNSIGRSDRMDRDEKEMIAAEVYDAVKQCLYETTMVLSL